MKKLILFELILLFLATTFMTDSPPPGWYQQSIPTNKPISDIFFIDSLKGWLTISNGQVYDSSKILATTDGGNTWITQYAKDTLVLNAIQFLNANTGYAVGGYGFGKIYKTTNSGTNWLNINTFAMLMTDVHFVNVDIGWVCDPNGLGGLYKTTDGGQNWQQQLNSSYTPSRLFFLNSDTGWAVCNSNKLYRTTNSGLSWGQIYSFTSTITNFYFSSRLTGFLIGGLPSGPNLLRTTDGGFSWDTVNNSIQFGGGQKLFLLNDTRGWIGSIFNTIVSTKDGYNWGSQYSPSYTSYSIHFVDSLIGWAGGAFLVHTTDGGGPINGIKKISSDVPADYVLYQNYPNPFNPLTKIKYEIKQNGRGKPEVKIIVYDITGRLVTRLVDGTQGAGTYEVTFDGTGLSSGIYFYSLIADGNSIDVKKMIMLK